MVGAESRARGDSSRALEEARRAQVEAAAQEAKCKEARDALSSVGELVGRVLAQPVAQAPP